MITLISSKDNELNDFCVNVKEHYTHMDELISYKIECSELHIKSQSFSTS